MDREKLEFKYFFNAGFDRVTCECDVEGTDVFYKGYYIGSVKWVLPEELAALDDEELEKQFACNGILL